jgi:DNA-binding NtrC family response regulator
MIRVLVMTPEAEAARMVRAAYADTEVHVAADFQEAEALPSSYHFEYAFVDISLLLSLGEGDDAGGLEAFRRAVPGARVVILSMPVDIRKAVAFVREGAADYLTYPIAREEVQLVRDSMERRERIRSELRYLRDRAIDSESLGEVTSRADSMKAVLHKIRQVAPTRSTVLLTGETGTGKSYLARVIHQNSHRADRQFISVHCGAIPDTLLESELFGHERGAFTGADRRKLGKFEIANGGTIFLDEIATVTPAMQVKLLNVLQERRMQRVGGERSLEMDVRVLAATNMDLEALTEAGSFRNDLYYRLNVFPIEVPPLRERREDIPLLVEVILERLRRSHQKDIDGVSGEVMQALLAYRWPGNVRELENLLERAFILESTEMLSRGSFPEEIFGAGDAGGELSFRVEGTLAEVRARALAEVERSYIQRHLEAHRGRIDATAKAAGITPRQLHKLMTRHGLKKEDFKDRPVIGTADSDS